MANPAPAAATPAHRQRRRSRPAPTSENLNLRDPLKALTLARGAATLQPKGHVLDTLATAYWANGLVDEAVRAEKQAAFANVGQKRFYMMRITKFTSQTYEESVREQEASQKTAQQELR